MIEACATIGRHRGIDVEDQGHPPVAQDGGGGDAGNVPVVGFETLDHDLALALNGVDQKGAAVAALGLDQQRHAVHGHLPPRR